MLPSIFGENLFDDFFDDDFFRMPAWTGRDPLYGKRGKNLMKNRRPGDGHLLRVGRRPARF